MHIDRWQAPTLLLSKFTIRTGCLQSVNRQESEELVALESAKVVEWESTKVVEPYRVERPRPIEARRKLTGRGRRY